MHKLHELLRMGDLAAFVGIVDDGGFAESARRRGVSASTLSRSVTRLEEQLKVTLLRRTTRSVEITPKVPLFWLRRAEFWTAAKPCKRSQPADRPPQDRFA
ncbi:LysR family transcriptional regulator [Rhodobacteraceae bacterium D3-12]|nr:LysR family transcriptional regulator [Rhodobacteraceae bacterium D3-12]